MTDPRDPEAIVLAWLEAGPTRLPESTRRAIAVGTPLTPQRRHALGLPWRSFPMNGVSRTALGAVAVVVIALGGLFILDPWQGTGGPGGPAPSPSPSPSPTTAASLSAAASPSAAAVPPMTEQFVSPWYGFTIGYPADWTAIPASTFFDPVAFGPAGGPSEWLDILRPIATDGLLRLGSTAIPAGEDGVDWISALYADCRPDCESIVIDGQPASLSPSDGDEYEAILVVGDRAYVFTLFTGQGAIPNGRAVFDALMATVDLRPEEALASAPAP